MLGGVSEGPILPTFELLKEAGFEGVELISPNKLDRDEVLRRATRPAWSSTASAAREHWKDTLSDPDPAGRRARTGGDPPGDSRTARPTAARPSWSSRPSSTKKVSYRDAYKRSQANIRKLIPDAERHGIKIAIEEVWNKFLLSPIEFARYIDEFESPWVGAYFDVGNVVEYGYPQEWIRELGKRILKIHIKEYAKAKRFNYPLGEGEIDWPAVRQALHRRRLRGLDHGRGRLRGPRPDEGRRPADGSPCIRRDPARAGGDPVSARLAARSSPRTAPARPYRRPRPAIRFAHRPPAIARTLSKIPEARELARYRHAVRPATVYHLWFSPVILFILVDAD